MNKLFSQLQMSRHHQTQATLLDLYFVVRKGQNLLYMRFLLFAVLIIQVKF